MSEPAFKTTVNLLHKHECPTCGCNAYDDDEDNPLKRFFRRMVWASQALGGIEFKITCDLDGEQLTLKAIDVLHTGEGKR